MRKLYFIQVTDSRFCDNPYELLLEMVTKLQNDLWNNGVNSVNSEIYRVDFNNNYQYRCDFIVDKSNSKLTWNSIYKIINNVKAVPYKLK